MPFPPGFDVEACPPPLFPEDEVDDDEPSPPLLPEDGVDDEPPPLPEVGVLEIGREVGLGLPLPPLLSQPESPRPLHSVVDFGDCVVLWLGSVVGDTLLLSPLPPSPPLPAVVNFVSEGLKVVVL